MQRAKRTAFCAKCNAERPVAKQPVVGRKGLPLRRKLTVCVVCRERVVVAHKWQAKPTMGTTGRMRHSKSEAKYEEFLVEMQKAGVISDLRMCNDEPRESYRLDVYGTQAVDDLLAAVERRDALADVERAARDVVRSKQHIENYAPDFSYNDRERRRHVVDVKGARPRGWAKTKALMRACHNIEVEEVKAVEALRAGKAWRWR